MNGNEELERLKRELEQAQDDLTGLAPDRYRRLLRGYDHPMETFSDYRRWEMKAADEIADSVKYDAHGHAPCPLCRAMVKPWGDEPKQRGWTSMGLLEHLLGQRNVTECSVFRAASRLLRDENQERFRASDRREHEETERRKKIDPMIRLDLHAAPEFFDKSYDTLRSPEELARVVAQLCDTGFVVEQTDNVTAYKLVRDNWMMLADPRREKALYVRVYSGKTDKLGRIRWKAVQGFRLRGLKDWPAKIEAKFQEAGASPPVKMPDPLPEPKLPEPKPEEQQAAPKKRPMPSRISMWDALQTQRRPVS